MKKLVLSLALTALQAFPGAATGFNYTIDTGSLTAEIIAAGDVVDPYEGDVEIPATITDGTQTYTVTSIGNSAFNSTDITSVKLPATIKTIKQGAFQMCYSLTEVILNEGLETMEWDCFNNTKALKAIEIPGSLKTIPSNAFGYSGLETVIVKEGVEKIKAAFTMCANLHSVTLPETITELDGSFENCSALTAITLPSSLRAIGWFTFAGTAITTLEIPEGVEELDMQSLGMMNGDHNRDYTLKKVVFPASLKSINAMALNNRYGLTELVLNGTEPLTINNTTLLDRATALETIVLNRPFVNAAGTDVTSLVIGTKPALANIVFGEQLAAVPALTGCAAIRDIKVYNSVPPAAGGFSEEVYANAVVTVPCGTLAAYKAADVWKNFANLRESDAVTTIDASKIRHTVGAGANLYAVVVSFGNPDRLDNLVLGYRTDAETVDPAAVVAEIAAADKRLSITDGEEGIASARFDLDGNNEFDLRDTSGEGSWAIASNLLASDKETRVIALTNGTDALTLPYYFYLPTPDEEGVWVPEAMTVKLSDNAAVIPVLVQPQGKTVGATTNWQASSSDTSYRLDRTKVVTPYTFVDGSYHARPTFTGATGTTYMRYRPQIGGTYKESNYMALTIEAPEVPVTAISVAEKQLSSGLNKTVPFEYTYEPENATYTAVNITSGNTQVATWSASAGLKSTTTAGTAEITVASKSDSSVKASFTLTTALIKPVTGVNFGPGTEEGVINVPVKQLIGLRPVIEPADADIPEVSITLSGNGTSKADYTCTTYKVNYWDENRTRSQFFELSGHRPTGDNPAKITVTSVDGRFTKEFTVNVIEADRAEIDHEDGTIILNEEWFGHTNGGLNYLTADDEVIYQAYEQANPGMSFGCTSQYGTIWAGKLIVVSKQAADGGDPLPGGGRLVIADAKTFKRLGSIDNLTFDGQSGDGRAVAGATPDKIYVGSSNGIYVVNIADPANPVITGRVSGGDGQNPYSKQTGDMVTARNRVFAVMQNTGLIVIDTATDDALTIEDANIQGVTQSADGNVWYATAGNNGQSRFVALDPETLEQVDDATMPAECGMVQCGWGAWRSTQFTASRTANELWFVNGAGGIGGGGVGDYYRYTIGTDPSEVDKVFSLSAFNDTVQGLKQQVYGTVRVDSRDNSFFVLTTVKNAASGQYRDNWIHRVDAATGEIKKTIHLNPYYWFQSLPIFPDKYEPEIGIDDYLVSIVEGEREFDLTELVTDRDNIDANIRLTLLDEPSLLAEGDEAPKECVDVRLEGRKLIVTPNSAGTRQFTLAAESNGRTVSKTFAVEVTDRLTGIEDAAPNRRSISCDGRRAYFRGLDGVAYSLYDTNGREITRFTVGGDYYVAEFALTDGIYILRGSNGSTAKIILNK